MTDTQTFGSVDPAVEDAQIRNQPPLAVGNPRGGSLIDQLKAKFAGYDQDKVGTLKLTARNGAPVWLEFNLDIGEDELKAYAKTEENRAARRNKGKQAKASDISRARVSARLLSDHNTRIWFDNPDHDGQPLTDEDGDPLTVHSDEWLAITGDTDPVQALRTLFGDWAIIDAGDDYAVLAGFDEGSEIVDPTSGSSGD